MSQLFELFPTPVLRVERFLSELEAQGLVAALSAQAHILNHRSEDLSHTQILDPATLPALADLAGRLAVPVGEMGEALFGERLDWSIKEMWANTLRPGGHQAVHNHANCFVSGILYLTASHPSSNTLFTRGLGGRDFVFANTHANAAVGPFNAQKWRSPDPSPGDLLVFPSYLLHEVPTNQGALRVSLAFNAIPRRLDAWGYAVSFSR